MTRTLAAGAVLLLAAVASHACRDTGGNGNANTKITCDAIHSAARAGTLDSHATETEVKIDASHSGVPEAIRAAIDSYYRGDRTGGRQAMLVACADAGYPA